MEHQFQSITKRPEIMNFIEKALKYKQVTLSVLFLFFVIGVYSLLTMSRREDPKITIREGLVVSYYPGANSSKVEEQVTKKIEEYLFKFEEVDKIKTTSSSEDGMSIIKVTLSEDVTQPDIFWSKLNKELLIAREFDLPQSLVGPVVDSNFGDTEAMIIGISGDNIPYDQLKLYAKKLEDKLRSIPSVSKVKREGELKEEILISSNRTKLAMLGVDQNQVYQILQTQNNVAATGDIKINNQQVPLHNKGNHRTIEDLGNQIISTSESGSTIRLKDVASLERSYKEAESKIKINGKNGMIVCIQMKPGNNIVDFGEDVNTKVEEFKNTVPSKVKVTTIADQPKIVDNNISHFINEFFLAIISVVVVIILMLPFRIAMVAAMAIPMTVAFTLAVMNMFGIELHQVSLAGLIVVLGLVVDDAIVVADNYVELLDKGHNRWDAAWKSAYDLIVPIFVATFTIIFAFMPMVILSGSTGEFIRTLPYTVAIALVTSFIVAMVFTPMLCYAFITKGLQEMNQEKKKKFNFVDAMQSVYEKMLLWCVANPIKTILGSVISLFLAILLLNFGIKEKFFPAAERDQFVIELWMPTGTNLKATEEAIDKIESVIKKDKRIVNYTSFIGTSSPRFYYNFAPEFPVTNFGQILVNTTSVKDSEDLYNELKGKLDGLLPEGTPQVRLMQQGESLKSSIEVQVWGDDITQLKEIGDSIQKIIKSKSASNLVRTDFKQDYLSFDINLKPEASRLGFTSEIVSNELYANFKGLSITQLNEGDNQIDVTFKLEDKDRETIEDIENVYLTSPTSGAKILFSQIAEIKPSWQTGRIMHKNGMLLLTVQTEANDPVLPSELLKEIKPDIAKLSLPENYKITYGGEEGNQENTFNEMIFVLGISLILIFFIILVQFKDLRESTLIMLSIPMSLFGAILGLFITNNNFGFTAFVGLISLSGVVVRNAIILIEHIHELVKHENMDYRTATIESGKRRLRPIFLTAMAAAVGVLPMIVSKSPMWSPLASVIAVGVIWSIFIALLTIPVIYLLWIVPVKEKENQKSTNLN
nr:efflux RND transporter permease subunit [uncultured Flavobacterium sp.]